MKYYYTIVHVHRLHVGGLPVPNVVPPVDAPNEFPNRPPPVVVPVPEACGPFLPS